MIVDYNRNKCIAQSTFLHTERLFLYFYVGVIMWQSAMCMCHDDVFFIVKSVGRCTYTGKVRSE